MPLYRHDNRFLYFAHIPKCGGKSVASYLGSRFGVPAFLNSRAIAKRTGEDWTKTSPGHILWEDFDILIPPEWIEVTFGIVRHPLARLASAYNFQSILLAKIAPGEEPLKWFTDSLKARDSRRFVLDHHLEPQVNFMPANSKFFRLEDGLDKIIPFVDGFAGSTRKSSEIEWLNSSTPTSTVSHQIVPFPESIAEAAIQTYSDDFDRFGYAKDIPKNLVCYIPKVESGKKKRWWK